MVFPSTITFDTGIGWGGSFEYEKTSTTSSSVFYELYHIGGAAASSSLQNGIEFRQESDGSTKVYANSDNNAADPAYVSVGSGSLVSSVTITSGDVLNGWKSSTNQKWRFTVSSDMIFSGGTSTESSTSSAVASLGLYSGVLKMFIPASSTGGSYSVFEGSTLKQVTTHAVTVADMVPITSWSMGNYSIWRVYFNGNIINTWPVAIPSTSTIKKVHCNFW